MGMWRHFSYRGQGIKNSFVTHDGRWKYALHWKDAVDELYDLKNDPGELHNLWSDPAHAETSKEQRQRIIDWLYETSHPYADLVRKDKMEGVRI